MKVKINKYGQLAIERGVSTENWKIMGCPYCPAEDTCCGDWCPHFDVAKSGQIIISLCHATTLVYEASNFIDERP